MYSVSCPFCNGDHSSEFADELEEIILNCRSVAPKEKWGLLEYGVPTAGIITVEAGIPAGERWQEVCCP